jgi:LSD1 subclass zinc finger protein
MGMTGAGWRCRAAVVPPGMRSVKCLWCNTMQNVPESQRAYECWQCATPTAATVQLQDSAQEFLKHWVWSDYLQRCHTESATGALKNTRQSS